MPSEFVDPSIPRVGRLPAPLPVNLDEDDHGEHDEYDGVLRTR